MISISLCMIVRNEETVLGRCLDSVEGLTDEIVIVDTGSEDRTKEIARQYTDRVYDFPWGDDFSAARNFAFSKARSTHCMWLDADDVLPPAYRGAFQKMREGLPQSVDMVMMPYQTEFDEEGSVLFSYERERIVRNSEGYRFAGRVHEAIVPSGSIVHVQIPIEHHKVRRSDGGRNLRIYTKMEEAGEPFEPRALYYYGRELMAHGQYAKAKKIFNEFLGRPDGWSENKIDATRQLAGCCYRLKQEDEALEALLHAFFYDTPRGESCCDLGRHFLDRGRYREAAYWYEQALHAEKKTGSGAFIQEDCYGFLPAISLCVCYDRMGDPQKAEAYNALAGRYRPNSFHYRQNKTYFENRKAQEKAISETDGTQDLSEKEKAKEGQ